MEKAKLDLIIDDFSEKISQFKGEPIYFKLYKDYDEKFHEIFVYFHSNLNSLFSYMNDKNEHNKHFNAEPSRELLQIIQELDDLDAVLKGTENEIEITEYYSKNINQCKNFLKCSGGSTIPDDFEKIQIIRYEPIFKLTHKIITITEFKPAKLIMKGEGAFSIVYKYNDENYNKDFALKKLKSGLSERELQRFKKEFEIMKSMSSPYIVEVYKYNNSNNSYSMELCDCTLEQYVTKHNNKQSFTHEKRKNLAVQFLRAIAYLHSKGHLHRDISFKNILLKFYDNELIVVKLSDFGLIKEKGSEFTLADSSLKGTIIDDTLKSFAEYGLTNEIYAVGMVLNFIFTGRKHFHNDNSDISNMVYKCIDRDIAQRYKDLTSLVHELHSIKNHLNCKSVG